ncbi:MAG TPA: MAPEG family protein [Rhodanobacteraceae bacterium]|nr:MAPEG family protein [Rhodanobacteraceae bacterium]
MQLAGFYIALNALLMLALAMRVMWLRNTRRVGLGTGGDETLARAIRAHGNATEYVPLALLMLALLAFEQFQPVWLHVFGITLLVARVLHALGLSSNPGLSFGRVAGITLTLLVMIAMAVALIVCFVTR